MDATGLLLIYGGLFVGVLILVEGLYHLLVDLRFAPRSAVNRRLRMLASGTDPEEVLRLLRRQNRHSDSVFQSWPGVRELNIFRIQSGVRISLNRLLALIIGITMLVYGALHVLGVGLGLSLVLALGLGVGIPVGYVVLLRRRRLSHFGRQLPDALDLVVRSLRAGHPLSAALNVVAEEMPDPMGSEFGATVDETTYGLSLPDAVENMTIRVGHPDLQYFVVSIRIQYGTGGNLADILAGLSKIIRDRFTMNTKIQAVSAEGRLSSVILSMMPVLVAMAIMALHRDYYISVADDPLFPRFLYLTIGLIVINLLVMRRLVNFKF
jgi:tight adherence protein B